MGICSALTLGSFDDVEKTDDLFVSLYGLCVSSTRAHNPSTRVCLSLPTHLWTYTQIITRPCCFLLRSNLHVHHTRQAHACSKRNQTHTHQHFCSSLVHVRDNEVLPVAKCKNSHEKILWIFVLFVFPFFLPHFVSRKVIVQCFFISESSAHGHHCVCASVLMRKQCPP